MHDAFICHASEDKLEVARPLADALLSRDLDVWYDEISLKVGDNLRQEIDKGLANSRFGIVVFSPAFFAKQWTQYELDGLISLEMADGRKRILPVWHNVDQPVVALRTPALAGRVAARMSEGFDRVVDMLVAVLGPTALPTTPTGPYGKARLVNAPPGAEAMINRLRHQIASARETVDPKESGSTSPTISRARSVVERAHDLRQREDLTTLRHRFLRSSEGVTSAGQHIETLLDRIGSLVTEIGEQTGLTVRYERARQRCGVSLKRQTLTVAWSQQWTNSLEHSSLFLMLWGGPQSLKHPSKSVVKVHEWDFDFDRSLDGALGWREKVDDAPLIQTEELAGRCLDILFDAVEAL